jgi:hypothetical protein
MAKADATQKDRRRANPRFETLRGVLGGADRARDPLVRGRAVQDPVGLDDPDALVGDCAGEQVLVRRSPADHRHALVRREQLRAATWWYSAGPTTEPDTSSA